MGRGFTSAGATKPNMGKYDRELKDAKKIIDDWAQEAKGYRNEFINLKMDNLKWEKQAIQQSRALLDSRKYQRDRDAYRLIESTILHGKERLDTFTKEGEQDLKDLNVDLASGGAREGYPAIAARLKLGKPGEEKYEAVRKEIGSNLEKVSKDIRDTEGLWNKEIKIAIENQRQKLKTLAKDFYLRDEARDRALANQMVKVTAEFQGVVKKTIDGFLFLKDHDDLNQVTKGGFDAKDSAARKQKFKQYQNKLGMISSSRATIEKSLETVRKSFPPEFLTGDGQAGYVGLIKAKTDAFVVLVGYQKYYTTLSQEFQKRKWA